MNSLFPDFQHRHLPELDVSEYKPPTEFPPIHKAKRLVFDLETQGLDPLRGGYIVGVAVQAEGVGGYYPVRHLNGPNVPKALDWIRDELRQFKGEIVGANVSLFDGFFCHTAGITAPLAKWRDVQWAEALLDEYALQYRLDALAKKYLSDAKLSADLEDKYGDDVKAHFAEVHPGHTAPYAMQDLALAEGVWDKQVPVLKKERLWDLFLLESRLTPLLHEMRAVGVDVDVEKAAALEQELRQKYKETVHKMEAMLGMAVDPFAPQSLVRAFDALGVQYPLTEKNNPSFTNQWLKNLKHPFADLLNEAREYEKIRGTFVEGYILKGHIGGTVHTELHPLRRADDEGTRGTVSGRFSSSNPNLQNIPVRTELGKKIRELFVPQTFMDFFAADFSQMEYRLLVHFAYLRKCDGAEAARQRYVDDPDTDFHAAIAELTGLPRKQAKNLNFGLGYGMGVRKLANTLGLADSDGSPSPEAKSIMETYHARAPFIKEIFNQASERAQKVGYVKTILNRRCRFNLYEPDTYEGYGSPPLPHKAAMAEYGAPLRRARTHKALNSILQGSNADITKKAMVDIYESGLLKPGVLSLQLTVHDELDGSVSPDDEGQKALGRLKEMMRDSVKLEVPVMVSVGTGANWGEAH